MHSLRPRTALVAWLALPMAVPSGTGAAQDALDPGPSVVVVLPDTAVRGDRTGTPHVEPYVTVGPGGELLAGAIVASPVRDEGPWHCAVFRSDDDGEAWSRHAFPMRGCVDPWVLFTADGGALFTGIEVLEEPEGVRRLHLVLFRSPDGGRTWPIDPASLGRAFDHELLAADRSGGRRHGTVYLAAQRTRERGGGASARQVVVLRSRDHGRSFETAARLRPFGLPLRPTGLEVLSDGRVVVTIHDRRPDARDGPGSRRAWSMTSDDGGRTFSRPRFVTGICGPSDVFPGYPYLAADGSDGPFRDRLYHACIRTGVDGVALSVSDDAGRSWSDPVRVDPPPGEGPSHARTPMLAVDGRGVVGVAWYDRRLDPDRACQDVFFTASTDGGRTFAPPLRVSSRTSCPGTAGNGRAGESWPMGGDYSSLAALPGGGFHLLWADSRGGVFQLRQARLEVPVTAGPGERPPAASPGTDPGGLRADGRVGGGAP